MTLAAILPALGNDSCGICGAGTAEDTLTTPSSGPAISNTSGYWSGLMNDLLPKSIRYISLGTFRNSGFMVPTPVWFAGSGGTYYVVSAEDAGKVKRLRNNDNVKIAPCTVSGKLTGQWLRGRAQIVSNDGEVAAAYQALRAKYGWQLWLLDLFARIGGHYNHRALIRIDLPGRETAPSGAGNREGRDLRYKKSSDGRFDLCEIADKGDTPNGTSWP